MMAGKPASEPLPAALLEWWFAPWSYAATPGLQAVAAGLLAQRDDYRGWCARHAISPDLPSRYEAGWHSAALRKGSELMHCASLFGGLFAARERDQAILSGLSPQARQWCLKVALGQPLQALIPASLPLLNSGGQAAGGPRGLCELAVRLERRFPGLWPRLALMLPAELGRSVSSVLQSTPASATGSAGETDSAHQRALRCWRLCVEQTRLPAAVKPV